MGRAKTLLIPARLCVVILSSAGASACGSSPGSMADAGRGARDGSVDAKAEASVTEAGCAAPTPKGKLCITHCLQQEATEAPIAFACDVFCDLPTPDAALPSSLCYDTDGGLDEDDCMRTVFTDGGSQVLC